MNDTTNDTATVDRADERERVLRAFQGGGSVMYSGKIISRREDLPDDHPARWEDDEEDRIAAAAGNTDVVMLARIAELETWLKQREATIDALQATNDQLQLALDAIGDERDAAVDALTTQRPALPAADASTSTTNPPVVSVPPPAQSVTPPPATSSPLAPAATDSTATTSANAPTGAAAGTPLPLDFPKRSDLVAANLSTVEAVKALGPSDLIQINGIGPAAATAITERLATL